jgi:hypothetical protein
VKSKIIKRKYFKEPQETNLLTWEAKEQIRFLVEEYPDEWGIDQIVESFPITRNGVIRLLKSKFVPKTMEELVRHDKAVRKNWKLLKGGGGPTRTEPEQEYSKELRLIANACGVASLPKPKMDPSFLQAKQRPPPGPHETMYLKIVGEDVIPPSDPQVMLEANSQTNLQTLKKLAESRETGMGETNHRRDKSRVEEDDAQSRRGGGRRWRDEARVQTHDHRSAILDAEEYMPQEDVKNEDHFKDFENDLGMAGTKRLD